MCSRETGIAGKFLGDVEKGVRLPRRVSSEVLRRTREGRDKNQGWSPTRDLNTGAGAVGLLLCFKPSTVGSFLHRPGSGSQPGSCATDEVGPERLLKVNLASLVQRGWSCLLPSVVLKS